MWCDVIQNEFISLSYSSFPQNSKKKYDWLKSVANIIDLECRSCLIDILVVSLIYNLIATIFTSVNKFWVNLILGQSHSLTFTFWHILSNDFCFNQNSSNSLSLWRDLGGTVNTVVLQSATEYHRYNELCFTKLVSTLVRSNHYLEKVHILWSTL